MYNINFIDSKGIVIDSIIDPKRYLLNMSKGDFIILDEDRYEVAYKEVYFDKNKCTKINIVLI